MDEPLIFYNDDAGYIAWLGDDACHDRSGFVLNAMPEGRAGRTMLHTVRCGHLCPPPTYYTHTIKRRKVCADDLHVIEHWARRTNLTYVRCPDCDPA